MVVAEVKKPPGSVQAPEAACFRKRRKWRRICGMKQKHRRTIAGAVLVLFVLAGAWQAGAAEKQPLLVEVAAKPGGEWKSQPTRTVDDLPPAVRAATDGKLSIYGGRLDRKAKATGFFYPVRIDGRWWLVDPEGCLFIHKAVVSVSPLRTAGAQEAFKAKFGSDAKWAQETTALLREHGFNGVGAWSDTEKLGTANPPLVYTRIWNFMSSYGKKRGGTYQKPGQTGYPNDCIFVFDPEFEAFCDEHAKQLAATKDDPWLLGHFSDNEMPLKRAALAGYLKFPPTDPGHQAALAFLRQRHGNDATAKSITPQDETDFLAIVVDRYYRITSKAIRKYDPNHLFLGSRFHGSDLSRPEIFKAAGPYLDIVAVNYYHAWTPDPKRLEMWASESGRPVMITEWYAKGADSGFANTGGAGFLVKTQRDRGLFYENFTLGLLESRVCVGWHWFKYGDNDPADTKADPSNRDSNKGIVTNRYETYPEVLRSMKRVNERAYGVIDGFDGK